MYDSHVKRAELEKDIINNFYGLTPGEMKGLKAIAEVGEGIGIQASEILSKTSTNYPSAKAIISKLRVKTMDNITIKCLPGTQKYGLLLQKDGDRNSKKTQD